MRKPARTIGILILLCSFLSIQQALHSQEFLKKASEINDVTFHDLQRNFDEWEKTVDLSKTKGWKQFKRWEDFNTKRASEEGTLPDPRIYYNEVKEIIDQKRQVKKAHNDDYSWTPVGLFKEAGVYSDENITGIGRINCMAFHPTDPNTFWVGVGQGGVWKTSNRGKSWMPLTDELPLLRISDICVDKNNPDIIYISVGDFAYLGFGLTLDHRKRHSHYGMGVFKTSNGGQTWVPTGLSFEQSSFDGSLTRRVFIDEQNSDILLAAGTHGIWKSNDGGDNWFQIINALIWDIERDPNNPNTLYASKGYVWTLDIGKCGIIKSYDFGNTWTDQNINVPAANQTQRLEIAISPSDSNYVYVAVSAVDGSLYGIYATTDAGQNWELKANSPNIFDWHEGDGQNGIGSYALAILVDPNDKNKLFAGSVNLWGSDDGGTTWDAVTYWINNHGPSIHCDQHFLTHNPIDSKFYICNDGGLYSTDELIIGSWSDAKNQESYKWPTNWTSLNSGLAITSFYRMGLSKNNGDYLIGGAQDNSSFFYNRGAWYNTFVGDGMECIIHPINPNIIYCSAQRGYIGKSTDGGVSFNEGLTKSIYNASNQSGNFICRLW
ncbi:WD40/YVTN/BNR-like repeat-containing protein [Bacteroidota bacterium]